MRSSALLIVNPISTKYKESKIDAARAMLKAAGYSVDLYLTQEKGHAESRAKQAVSEPYSLVFAGGGDGTVNEVANGLAFSNSVMGILPLGGSNVFSREIGSKGMVHRAVASAIAGRPHRVSLGRIRAPWGSRYFTTMSGIGFDALTVYNVDKALKKVIGVPAYVVSGIRCLLSYKTEAITLRVDGRDISGYSAIISNATRYGGDFRIAPQAGINMADLYVHVFQGWGRGALLKHTAGILGGLQLDKLSGVLGLRCSSISITAESHIQMDGDYFGKCSTNDPVEIDVCKDALMLVY
ncbi:MAG: diacylglycerol kinase family lipid kinase [Nitrospirae bacterium]|nr:diacylglycerol kinase family lipid kinase [Nitrospirota bacterium]